MPFASLERPALGLSLLKARLVADGVQCDAAYLNLEYASRLGHEDYEVVATRLPYVTMPGEWVFARALWGEEPDSGDYVAEILAREWRVDRYTIDAVVRARSLAEPFLKCALVATSWDDYDVVGFTSFCTQNTASLALARRVKALHPGLVVVIGGHNWSGSMGRALHRHFPFVDYAFLGEADESLPALVRSLAEPQGRGRLPLPAGVSARPRGRRISATPAAPVSDLDGLPIPDHSDYFRWLDRIAVGLPEAPVIPLETSRGCWWSSTGGCAFCGLNGDRQPYRWKSPERVVREIDVLTEQWPDCPLDVVDNVVSPRFLAEVMPVLADRPHRPGIRLKIRPDASRHALELVARANGTVLCGIESLSDHLLGLMNKGVTSLEGIRLLKWCDALDLPVTWNMLCRMPGECADDYAEQVDLLGAIQHLEPPDRLSPITLERSSHLWQCARQLGLGALRPAAAYRYIYPFVTSDLVDIAYHFESDYLPDMSASLHLARLQRGVGQWRERRDEGKLTRDIGEDGTVVLSDSRECASAPKTVLDAVEGALFAACDDVGDLEDLQALARSRFGESARARDVRDVLDAMVGKRLMVRSGRAYLNLATPSPQGPSAGPASDQSHASAR